MKRKKPVYFKDRFTLELYKATVTYVLGDFGKYSAMLEKKYGYRKEREREPAGNTLRLATENEKGEKGEEYILWLAELNYPNLAHEAVHLATYIFDARGIDGRTQGDDEPFAFLVEWIVGNYLAFVDYFKGKKKKK